MVRRSVVHMKNSAVHSVQFSVQYAVCTAQCSGWGEEQSAVQPLLEQLGTSDINTAAEPGLELHRPGLHGKGGQQK